MADYFGRLGDALIDLSPGGLIGALAVALGLALAGSGLTLLVRGRGGRDSLATACGPMLLVSVASMALALGHGRPSAPDRQAARGGSTPSTAPPGRSLLDAADADGDGHLTAREAIDLVRRADTNRKGYADQFDLDHVAGMPPPPPPAFAAGPVEGAGARRNPCPPESIAPEVVCYPPTGGPTGHEGGPWPRAWPIMSQARPSPDSPQG